MKPINQKNSSFCLLPQKEEDVVALNGDLTLATVHDLWNASELFFNNAKSRIVIDLQQVTHSDSAGVALLITWIRTARQHQKEIFFTHLPQQILAIAQVCGLNEFFPADSNKRCLIYG